MTATPTVAALAARVEALEALVAERAPHPCRCTECVGERLRQASMVKAAEIRKTLRDFAELPAEEFLAWFSAMTEHRRRVLLQDLEPDVIGKRLAQLDAAGRDLVLDDVNDPEKAERAVFAAIKVEPVFTIRSDSTFRSPPIRAEGYKGFVIHAGVPFGPDPKSWWRSRLCLDKRLAEAVKAGKVTATPLGDADARKHAHRLWMKIPEHERPSIRSLLEAGKF